VIRREILLKEGDVFSAGKVRRSVEKIYNLGFLDDVQVDVQQPRSPTEADIVFNVVEGKPGILSAGAGYSSVDNFVGTLQVQHINLFGRAQRLNLMWEFGDRKKNYEIGWTEPWIFGKPVSFGVDLFNTERQLPYGTDRNAYEESRKGFTVRLGPRLTDRLSLIHSYSYERVSKFNVKQIYVDEPDPARRILPGKTIISSLTNGLIYDTRDNVFDATRGTRNSASVQVAGGPLQGDINFYKPSVSSAIYFPTFWKFVLSFSGQGAYVKPFDVSKSSNIPESERFYIGGVDTVRGYRWGEIGEPAGNFWKLLFNAEYKFPIVQERNRTILQGAFFADVGGGWSGSEDIVMRVGKEPNNLRSGVGFGIRFKTPVFPIRLDWGYGLNHQPGEELSHFYFTIGNIF
jgi:outer membrane protein insertion porin family